MSQQQNISYFTEEGLKKLQEELHFLKTKERASITKQIAEARDKGDLSENAEYDAAREAQGMLEARIAKLEDTLSNARLRDASSLDASKVSILTKVKIKNTKTNQIVEYTLVTQSEANLKEGKISVDSPIGKGLMGKKVGDKVDVTVPAGVIPFEIMAISV
ncbi:MAG TPA: transcription elongation factor GreA [Bacteroidia bacterium]|jgi:transcription elongation factor GreA|nr:transcription elongation factor GreA [Bacteroidia bacterium]